MSRCCLDRLISQIPGDYFSQHPLGEKRKTAESHVEPKLKLFDVGVCSIAPVPSLAGQCKTMILVMNLGNQPQNVLANGVGQILFSFHQPVQGQAQQHGAGGDDRYG
ncbi:hypothetical protein IB238_24015 [Rhizobium sp. ARZ01]|uniref:hypothetical protein n=1 Tax=Rhizobium sp. ARZ01 TaxID=2769313 RepID=UPI0017873934|nr:hypothetical protein [Rhizobium sp. ARZ01]MBD9375675.1 hypothetical protein [Rhizobium sp. ARZ01]